MVKKFSALLIALCVVFTMFAGISVSAADQLECTYRVDYENSVVYYEITTPARYRQLITVTLSKGGTHNDVVRVEEVRADLDGKVSGSFQLTTGDSMGSYVLKASGAGYLQNVSNDSDDVYYENYNDIYGAGGTLERFNTATTATIGDLFLEKKGMFNYDFGAGSDYEQNSAWIHEMFIAIRTDDYNGSFANFTDVLDAMGIVSAIREFSFISDPAEARKICEDMAVVLNIDMEDEDYAGHEEEIYTCFLPNYKENPVKSTVELRQRIQQSIGIAKLNRSDAVETTTVIREYGELIGIDLAEYERKIVVYDELQFNRAFVGLNFETAKQVVKAYKERVANPPLQPEIPNDGSDFTGSSSSGGGTRTPYNKIIANVETETKVDNNESKLTLTDVTSDHWAYESVKTLFEAGVISGFEDGSFKPEDSVTREQFVKMLVAAFEMEGDADANYSDVPKNAWYYEAVAIATANDITKGYGNEFGVGKNITREDAAVMIYRIIEATKAEVTAFDDDASISSYAKDAVYGLSNAGVINGMGDGSFAPKANLTRAQAAKIIYTALKYDITK